MPAKRSWITQWLDLWFAVEFLSLKYYKDTHTQNYVYDTHIQTTLWHSYQHTYTIVAALLIQLALYAEAENRNIVSICFIDQTWKK